MRRNRRSGVEDLWYKTVRSDDGTTEKQRSARYGAGSRWRARYVDDDGLEHSKAFAIKAKAQAGLISRRRSGPVPVCWRFSARPSHLWLNPFRWLRTLSSAWPAVGVLVRYSRTSPPSTQTPRGASLLDGVTARYRAGTEVVAILVEMRSGVRRQTRHRHSS
jgi:hypothetical protein